MNIRSSRSRTQIRLPFRRMRVFTVAAREMSQCLCKQLAQDVVVWYSNCTCESRTGFDGNNDLRYQFGFVVREAGGSPFDHRERFRAFVLALAGNGCNAIKDLKGRSIASLIRRPRAFCQHPPRMVRKTAQTSDRFIPSEKASGRKRSSGRSRPGLDHCHGPFVIQTSCSIRQRNCNSRNKSRDDDAKGPDAGLIIFIRERYVFGTAGGGANALL